MKKTLYFSAIALITLGSSCGSTGTQNSEAPTATTETPKDTPPAGEQPEGMALMNSSDCNACHNPQQKVVGPALKDIAAKYPNTPENVAHLADQVIKGSTGVWGQVPMVPHANLQRGDAEKMVQYILSVK